MEGNVQFYKNKRYNKYWCVLEGQQLSYYERLDLQLQEPVNIQGVLFIQNAEINKTTHQNKMYVISIKCEGKKSIEYLITESIQQQTEWYKALEKSRILHEEERKRLNAPIQYRNLLGISQDEKLTQNVITRAYRKLCLKAHPDKGGDPNKFSEIHQAYTYLLALQVEEDEKNKSTEVEYEVTIEKAGGGVGLGIVVLEDTISKRILVQTVQKNICLRGLSEESEGEIRPGDSLTYIENDYCSQWPLSRIRARLNSTRVPTGSIVRLTLTRRIHNQIHESQSPPLSPIDSEKMISTKNNQLSRSSSNQKLDQNLSDEKINDDDNHSIPPPPPPPLLPTFPSRLSPPPKLSPPNTPSGTSFQHKHSSWTSDDEELSSTSQPGSVTPKSSPRPKKRLSISPTPSPIVQEAYTPSPGHTSFRLKSGFLGTNLHARGGLNYESKVDTPTTNIPQTSTSTSSSIQIPTSTSKSKQIELNHNSDEENHSELDESYESDGSGGKTIPRSSIGRLDVLTPRPSPSHLPESKPQVLGVSVPPMSTLRTDKTKLNSTSVNVNNINLHENIDYINGYEVIFNDKICSQFLQELQYQSIDVVLNKIQNNDDELKEIEKMFNELEDLDNSNNDDGVGGDNDDYDYDIPPPPPLTSSPILESKFEEKCRILEEELLNCKNEFQNFQLVKNKMSQHIEELTNELNEYKERSIALTSLLESKHESDNEENLAKVIDDKFNQIKEIKVNYKRLLNILKLYKNVFTDQNSKLLFEKFEIFQDQNNQQASDIEKNYEKITNNLNKFEKRINLLLVD